MAVILRKFHEAVLAFGLAFLFFSDYGGAAATLPNFRNLNTIYKVRLFLPGGFAEDVKTGLDTSLFIAAPLVSKEHVILYERYINLDYPFVSIIKLIIYEKFDDAPRQFDPQWLESQGLEILHREPKVFGSRGQMLQVRHLSNGSWVEKWIAVFGNDTQTNVVVVAFPAKRHYQMTDLLRRVAESAEMTAESY